MSTALYEMIETNFKYLMLLCFTNKWDTIYNQCIENNVEDSFLNSICLNELFYLLIVSTYFFRFDLNNISTKKLLYQNVIKLKSSIK